MSKDYATDKRVKSSNRKIAFFNLLIIAVSAACILSMIFTNFWSFKLKFKPTPSMISTLVPAQEGVNFDYEELLKGIEIKLEIKVSPDGFIKGVTAKGDSKEERNENRVKAVFTPAFDELGKQTRSLFTQTIKVALKMVKKMTVDEIRDQVTDAASTASVEAMDLIAGVENMIDEIMDTEGMTKAAAIAKLTDFVLNKVELDPSDPDYGTVRDEIEAQIDSQIGGMLDPITNSEDVISPETLVYKALGSALGLEGDFNPDSFVDDMTQKLAANPAVKVVVWALIIFWGFPIVLWALLALFAILRLFLPKKGVNMAFARIFCWIPCVLIWLLPTLLFWILPKVVGMKILPEQITGVAGEAMKALKITFGATGPIISSIGTIALMLFNWFGYKKAKKTVKLYS